VIPEVLQQTLGWQQDDIERLKGDMKDVKDDVHTLKIGIGAGSG